MDVNTLSVLFQMAETASVYSPPHIQGPPTTVTSRTISLVAFVSDIDHALGDDVGGDVLQYSGTLNYTPGRRIVTSNKIVVSPATFSGDVTSPGGGKMSVTIAADAAAYYTTIDVVQLLSGKPPSPAISVSFAPNPPNGAASSGIAASQLLNIAFAGSGAANGKTYSFSLQLDQYIFLYTLQVQ
jgi:hypothetical protein